jgi:hypothetical protein
MMLRVRSAGKQAKASARIEQNKNFVKANFDAVTKHALARLTVAIGAVLDTDAAAPGGDPMPE